MTIVESGSHQSAEITRMRVANQRWRADAVGLAATKSPLIRVSSAPAPL
jgi:hypothetical protein